MKGIAGKNGYFRFAGTERAKQYCVRRSERFQDLTFRSYDGAHKRSDQFYNVASGAYLTAGGMKEQQVADSHPVCRKPELLSLHFDQFCHTALVVENLRGRLL